MESTETQSIDYAKRLSNSNNTIKNYVIASMGAALVPVPLFDLVALSGIQLKMLHSLSKTYNIKFTSNLGKSLISALLGSVLPLSGALSAASAAKGMPGVGTAAGVMSMSILGGAATYAIGKVFVQHFESGGTFLDFDPEAVREHFAAEFTKGKDVATSLNTSNKGSTTTTSAKP
jgi:uncharacterized protein (DUF697 family)